MTALPIVSALKLAKFKVEQHGLTAPVADDSSVGEFKSDPRFVETTLPAQAGEVIEALVSALREAEYIDIGLGGPECSVCGHEEGTTHADDCALAAALALAERPL